MYVAGRHRAAPSATGLAGCDTARCGTARRVRPKVWLAAPAVWVSQGEPAARPGRSGAEGAAQQASGAPVRSIPSSLRGPRRVSDEDSVTGKASRRGAQSAAGPWAPLACLQRAAQGDRLTRSPAVRAARSQGLAGLAGPAFPAPPTAARTTSVHHFC